MKLKKHSLVPEFETSNSNNHKYDAVLIIGNGFDLSLGLKTSYNNFLESEFFLKLIKSDNLFAQHLVKKQKLNNWIDIENELSKYSTNEGLHNESFQQEFNDLSEMLANYLKSINIFQAESNSIAQKLIESIFEYKTLIIDFNYTNSIAFLIKSITKNKYVSGKPKITHIKIHGSLKDNNIIFGVEDKAKIHPQHIFLKKSVNQNYNPANFNTILTECNSIGIFGHSLGNTDHMYFSKYFLNACKENSNESNKLVTMFYYKEEGRLNIHRQLDILSKQAIGNYKQYNNVEFIDCDKISNVIEDEFCQTCQRNYYSGIIKDTNHTLIVKKSLDKNSVRYEALIRNDRSITHQYFNNFFTMITTLEPEFENLIKIKNKECIECN